MNNENIETAAELGINLACVECLNQYGISPHVGLTIVLVGSTVLRFLVDIIRIRMKKKPVVDDTTEN